MAEHRNGAVNGVSKFKAFGLTISSCLHFPELLLGAGATDLTVVYGEVPRELPVAQEKSNGVRYQAIPGLLLLEVPRIARFLIRDGNEIVIDRQPEATDDDLRLFLLGSCMGAILQQRGLLVLHGSMVQVRDACVLFLGNSGMGKTTLAATLARRGYSTLSDDVCAVSIAEDGVPYATSAYPRAKMWVESLQHFGIDPAELRRVRPASEKRTVPLESFCSADRVPVSCLYVLSSPGARKEAHLSVRSLTGPPRIRVLRDNTYRVEYLRGLNQTARHFQQIVHLASRLPVKRVFCARQEFAVEKLATVVENDFLS
jgi:hypothetical protein